MLDLWIATLVSDQIRELCYDLLYRAIEASELQLSDWLEFCTQAVQAPTQGSHFL